MSPLLGKTYNNPIGNDNMNFYGKTDLVHGVTTLDLVRKWYQTSLSVASNENTLMGDDLDGERNKKFLVPLNESYRLLICGGSWEKPALKKGNENRVFVRKAVIDTKTVVFVSIINVILLPGGHRATDYVDTEERRRDAVKEMDEAMDIEKVFARFKITGPHPSKESTTGVFLDKQDLLRLFTPLDQPFKDINPSPELETDPPEWKTLPMKMGFPAYTSGYYACLELRNPGTYIIDIDGSAPLAGHQDGHQDEPQDQQEIEKSRYHLEETIFHNSAKYELEVKET